jgi:hypothetical protein
LVGGKTWGGSEWRILRLMDSIIGEEMEKGRWSVVIGDAAWQLLSNGGERRIG